MLLKNHNLLLQLQFIARVTFFHLVRFLGQEKLTYGHDRTILGTEQGDFLGQEKSILGLFEMNYGT